MDGTRVIVGAPARDSETGRVYLFEWDGTDLVLNDTIDGTQAGERFGQAVAFGEGDHAIIGSPHYNGDDGRVTFVEATIASGFFGPVTVTAAANSNERFGFAIDPVDFDDDGDVDVAVGSPDYTATLSERGRVQLIEFDDGEYETTPLANDFEGLVATAHAGSAIASGDIDGDGFEDVSIGQPEYTSGGVSERGNAQHWVTDPPLPTHLRIRPRLELL